MTHNIPKDLYYTKTHEWVKREQNVVTIGLTDYAQHELDSIQFVEFPDIDQEIEKGHALGAIEAVKAAEDLVAPVSGKVTQVNEELSEEGEPIHKDPYGAGWLIKMECKAELLDKELGMLLDAEAYEKLLSDTD